MSKKNKYRRLKEAVKNGDMTPDDALMELTGHSLVFHYARSFVWQHNHTYQWLCRKAGLKP